ncbi:MAG: carbon starvation protein A, partial [Candidatus Krumholzibacteria bacterium]|nr:carbon starvation protein A [Candidatus Krumholzibacteria bacterium]
MNALTIALVTLAAYIVAYMVYARFFGRKILGLDPRRKTPASSFEDGVDFVPTSPIVLFGHHFASIAGLGPILGPAIAVIWGWLPAVLWILFGSILIGGIH